MTKPGYKQILVSIDTYKELKSISIKDNKSIDGVLKYFIGCSHSDDWGSNPHRSTYNFEIVSKNRIDTIGKIHNLTDATIRQYKFCHTQLEKFVGHKALRPELIEEYYVQSKQKKNQLGMLRLLYPELSGHIKFPKKIFKFKFLPSEDEIQIFYNALPEQYKPIFLLLRESGLRISELLSARIDPINKMLIPVSHTGQTKHSWISFYRSDITEIPKFNKDHIGHVFKKVSKETGIRIYPHLLRSVFARDCTKRGIPDRYIDAFCGRVPASVLARHYSDFSPEVLKEIYEK